jgi:hypothetical protein
MPSRLRLGKPDLEALSRTWGSQVRTLCLQGVSLAPGFFPALETCFPQLGELRLERLHARDRQGLVHQITLFCQRMARPMTIALDNANLYE